MDGRQPCLDDFLHRDALRATLRTSRESSVRRFRLGQWVEQVEGAWLPDGAWASCAVDGFEIPDRTTIVLGLDGSFSQDCAALVAVTVEDTPHVAVVALWESTGDGYRVPVAEVEQQIRQACPRFDVREVAADPFRWTRTPASVLAVTSGVSTDSMSTGIRMLGVSPSVTSTSAAPSDGMFAPTGDQNTCTASIIFTPPTWHAEDQGDR